MKNGNIRVSSELFGSRFVVIAGRIDGAVIVECGSASAEIAWNGEHRISAAVLTHDGYMTTEVVKVVDSEDRAQKWVGHINNGKPLDD